MEPENDNQSAELTRIESWTTKWIEEVSPMWPDMVAWMKQVEAKLHPMVGLWEDRLTTAAQDLSTVTIKREMYYPDPPKPPAPACEHEHQMDLRMGHWTWCTTCGALYNGERWMPPANAIQWETPVSREEPKLDAYSANSTKRPPLVSG